MKIENWMHGWLAANKAEREKLMEEHDIYITSVQERINGELYIEVPKKLMERQNWHIGDELVWEETEILTAKYENDDYVGVSLCKRSDWEKEIDD